jgi:hypothetical protein
VGSEVVMKLVAGAGYGVEAEDLEHREMIEKFQK